jgi:hypothetical protein
MSRTLLLGVSLIALSGTGAFADTSGHWHATLVNSAKERTFLAGDVAWHCDGTSCVTASPSPGLGSKRLCRALAKSAGPVASFEGLDAAQIQACNGTKDQ